MAICTSSSSSVSLVLVSVLSIFCVTRLIKPGRSVFAPDIDPDMVIDRYYTILKSIHNTIIEVFWRWLKEKLGLNLKVVILKGEHIYNSMVFFHRQVAITQHFCYAHYYNILVIFSIGSSFLSSKQNSMIFKHGGTSTTLGHNRTKTCRLAMFQLTP